MTPCPAPHARYGACILHADHAGLHMDNGGTWGSLCTATATDGTQCARPAGHDGTHRARLWVSWSDDGRLF